jgi:hypothetical protein
MTSVGTKQQTYNGWTNYETWLINLWLTNDELCYNDLMQIIQEMDDEQEMAEELKYRVMEDMDLNEISLRSDLLSAATRNVNWLEIIEGNQP